MTTTKTVTRLDMAEAILATSNRVTGHAFAKTRENLVFLLAWAWAEHGDTQGATFNMLDTEEGGEPGETDFNTAGVKDYPTLAEGVEATCRVMFNGYYPNIVSALERGNSALSAAGLAELSTWGTGQFQSVVTDCESNFTQYANVAVGTETVEEPAPEPAPEPKPEPVPAPTPAPEPVKKTTTVKADDTPRPAAGHYTSTNDVWMTHIPDTPNDLPLDKAQTVLLPDGKTLTVTRVGAGIIRYTHAA